MEMRVLTTDMANETRDIITIVGKTRDYPHLDERILDIPRGIRRLHTHQHRHRGPHHFSPGDAKGAGVQTDINIGTGDPWPKKIARSEITPIGIRNRASSRIA